MSRRHVLPRYVWPGGLALALALGVLIALGSVGYAGAASGDPATSSSHGVVKLELAKKAVKQMRKRGLKIRAGRGARVKGRALTLPVRGGEVKTYATLDLGGSVQIVSKARKGERKRGKATPRGRANRRSVRLTRMRVDVVPGEGHILARIKGTQVTLLTLKRVSDPPYNPLTGEVRFKGARAAFTDSALAAVSKRLRGRKLPRRIGRLGARGSVPVRPVDNTNATVRPRPESAVSLVDGELTWRPRPSFTNYAHSAIGGGVFAIAPALDGPEEPIVDSGTGKPISPSPGNRVYEFEMPFAGGWYDPASDSVNVGLGGAIHFTKPDFGIDFDAVEPVVELGGAEPRMVAAMRGRAATADQDGRTAVVVDLDPQEPTTETTPAGTRVTYTDIAATVPAGPTAWILASYYTDGSPWGEISVSYTILDD